MKNVIQRAKRFIADKRHDWQIDEVPGVVIGYDKSRLYMRQEIPFTLYIRRGRKHSAQAEFKILEWGEKLLSKCDVTDVHVRLLEVPERRSGAVIRRVNDREIVTTRSSQDDFTELQCRSMGSERLSLRLA